MGMMIFVMASGLTLIFGLMDVLNFGHGAFIAIGAYLATWCCCRSAAGCRRTRSGSISPPSSRRCLSRWRDRRCSALPSSAS
jgi:hypothetical protein